MLSSVIIGGGPGRLGPTWAAQHRPARSGSDRGVAVVERQAHLGGTLGRFGINSDSLGGSYLGMPGGGRPAARAAAVAR